MCAVLTLAEPRCVLLMLCFLRLSWRSLPKQQPFVKEDFCILPQAIRNSSYIYVPNAHAQAFSPGHQAQLRYTLAIRK